MYSLHTINALKWRSIFLITLLALVIGLVGLFSFNLPKNEVIAEAYVLPDNPAFVDDFPTLDYSGIPNISWSKGVIFDTSSTIPIFYANKITRLGSDSYIVYNNQADPYNLLTSSVYSIRANSLGLKDITYGDDESRFPVTDGKGILNVYIACSQIGNYFPFIYMYWYNSAGNMIGESSETIVSFFEYKDTFVLVSISLDAPVGATSFVIDLKLHFNHMNTQYYLLPGYTYISSTTVPRVSIPEMRFLSNLYGTGPYWHKRYLSSQESLELARESLELAQEQGATLTGALDSLITAPINAIAEFMTFEIPFFNVNLGAILAIIISILLVAFVIKILISRG